MKKSLCVPYAYGEKRLSVWEYLHLSPLLRQPPIPK
jgi:hypothetical protein